MGPVAGLPGRGPHQLDRAPLGLEHCGPWGRERSPRWRLFHQWTMELRTRGATHRCQARAKERAPFPKLPPQQSQHAIQVSQKENLPGLKPVIPQPLRWCWLGLRMMGQRAVPPAGLRRKEQEYEPVLLLASFLYGRSHGFYWSETIKENPSFCSAGHGPLYKQKATREREKLESPDTVLQEEAVEAITRGPGPEDQCRSFLHNPALCHFSEQKQATGNCCQQLELFFLDYCADWGVHQCQTQNAWYMQIHINIYSPDLTTVLSGSLIARQWLGVGFHCACYSWIGGGGARPYGTGQRWAPFL